MFHKLGWFVLLRNVTIVSPEGVFRMVSVAIHAAHARFG